MLKKLKITHISTSDIGGAAVAALRLHLGLLNLGVDSKFLCLYKSSRNIPEVYEFSMKSRDSVFKKILRRLGANKTKKQINYNLIKNKKGHYEIFTFPETDYRIDYHPIVLESDIINLHWVGNFLDYKSFFKSIDKPIVWTLHDMNVFQGGFHYLGDKVKNLDLWNEIENYLEQIKLQSLQSAKSLHVVTPSDWLSKAAESSEILGQRLVITIPYGLDLNIFKPYSRSLACQVFNLSENNVNIFFIAETLENYRKGTDLLIEAVNILHNEGYKFTLVTIGSGSINISKSINVVNIGSIYENRLMSIALSAANCFILPSREDNLPNVMLEALACGVPVISFPVGGMAEIIQTGLNGIQAIELSSKGLTDALRDFFDNKYSFDKNSIRQFAVDNFALEMQADRYLKLYNKII